MPVAFCPPHIPHGLAWDETWGLCIKGQWLNASTKECDIASQTQGVSNKALSHVTIYSHSLLSSGHKDVSSGWSFIYLMTLFQQPRLCCLEFRDDLWQINKKICRKQHLSPILRYPSQHLLEGTNETMINSSLKKMTSIPEHEQMIIIESWCWVKTSLLWIGQVGNNIYYDRPSYIKHPSF